jgi:hypothetical protein
MRHTSKLNLIQLQEIAVHSILNLPTQGKRSASYGWTCLNKSARGLRGVFGHYSKCAERLGFTAKQIALQWGDIKDTAKLEATTQ